MSASFAGHLEVVRLLLEKGADMNEKAEVSSNGLKGTAPAPFPICPDRLSD